MPRQMINKSRNRTAQRSYALFVRQSNGREVQLTPSPLTFVVSGIPSNLREHGLGAHPNSTPTDASRTAQKLADRLNRRVPGGQRVYVRCLENLPKEE